MHDFILYDELEFLKLVVDVTRKFVKKIFYIHSYNKKKKIL